MFDEMLLEMIELLKASGDEHWAKWFQTAYDLNQSGKAVDSYSKVLSAYGGMGSINDVFWNLPKTEFDRLEYLKGEVWKHAKSNNS